MNKLNCTTRGSSRGKGRAGAGAHRARGVAVAMPSSARSEPVLLSRRARFFEALPPPLPGMIDVIFVRGGAVHAQNELLCQHQHDSDTGVGLGGSTSLTLVLQS